MKILFITNKTPFPATDGGAIASLNMLTGFSEMQNDVTILSMSTKKHPATKENIPESLKSRIDFRIVTVPASINFLPLILNLFFSKEPYNATRFINTKFKETLIQILKEKKFDVIQLEGLYVCPYIPVIRANSSAKIAYRAHNIENEIWDRTKKMSKGIKKWYLYILANRIRRFELKWLNQYDMLVPITYRDNKVFNYMGNKKPSHVAYAGIDLIKFHPKAEYKNFISLFHIGSLDWSPNQEGLLWFLSKVWPEINHKYPDLKFHIAGRNAPKWLIRKFMIKNVIYEGEVNNAYDFINNHTVMIVPLFSGSGMRIKIIEGMALGKTVISTTIGAEGIETAANKNILITNTPEEFIIAISNLKKNPDQIKTIGDNAIQFIHENFNNLAIIEKLAAFYHKQLG